VDTVQRAFRRLACCLCGLFAPDGELGEDLGGVLADGAAQAACSAVDSDASEPGGTSGGRPGRPERDRTPAMAR
jgi:hypothetical protein